MTIHRPRRLTSRSIGERELLTERSREGPVTATGRLCLDHKSISIWFRVQKRSQPLPEDRSARLTILIDPRKKALLESLCAEVGSPTTSQVVRRLIRAFSVRARRRPRRPEYPNRATAKNKR